MEKANQTKAESALKLDFNRKDEIWLTNQQSLRKLVGFLGMALPIFLLLSLWMDSGHLRPLPSISHYYFTRAAPIFTITVSLLAIFLIIYKGEGRWDFFLSTTAGLMAIMLLIFPTNNLAPVCCDDNLNYAITHLRSDDPFRVSFHYATAVIFLVCLALISIFIFTTTTMAGSRVKKRNPQNKYYRLLGIIMLVVLVSAFICVKMDEAFYDRHNITFWTEVITIECFGLSWMIKGMEDKG